MSRGQTASLNRKGRETRELLLEATIISIARNGLAGLSHRAVAARADVSLALTTYYFANKQDMVAQAFSHSVERGRPSLADLDTALTGYAKAWRTGADRIETIDLMARRAVAFVVETDQRSRDGIAFELEFFYHTRLEPRLAKLVSDYRHFILGAARRFCMLCGSTTPNVDAELLVGLVLRLESEHMSTAFDTSEAHMHAQFERLFDTILAQKPPVALRNAGAAS
ncbi:MAG: TetR family transcriptional regulator [Pseudomonadota bacterium]